MRSRDIEAQEVLEKLVVRDTRQEHLIASVNVRTKTASFTARTCASLARTHLTVKAVLMVVTVGQRFPLLFRIHLIMSSTAVCFYIMTS